MENKREIIQNAKNAIYDAIKFKAFRSYMNFDEMNFIIDMIDEIDDDDILYELGINMDDDIDMDDDINMETINMDVLNYIINYFEETFYDGSFDVIYYNRALQWMIDNSCYDFSEAMELGLTGVEQIATYYRVEFIRELLHGIEV